jgi:3-oxoadipate enol-lactonase
MPFARCGDLVVHHDLSGPAGAPVVLLANSLGTTAHMWDAQIDALSTAHRVLRYDMRGHGLTSSGPRDAERGTTIAQLADDAAALLDALRIERATFVGLSIGGMIGQRFAAAYAGRVDALALCATASRIGTPENWNARIALVESEGMAPVVEPGMERWFSPRTRRERPDLVRGFATMLGRTPPLGYAAACKAVRDGDLRADAARIACRTLVVAGADDPVTTPDDARALSAAIAGAELLVLDDAAHILCAERPDAFNAALLAFLGD